MAGENMIIKIPQTKRHISRNKAVGAAIRAFEGKRSWIPGSRSCYDLKVEDGYFYPYWIGEVYTRKARFLFKPKEITFFVICDAVHNDYIVLRGLPKLEEVAYDEKYILPPLVNRQGMEKVIVGANKDRIDRQFIFGAPYKEIRDIFLTHIPGSIIKVRNKETREFNRFFVNSLTGEVKLHS